MSISPIIDYSTRAVDDLHVGCGCDGLCVNKIGVELEGLLLFLLGEERYDRILGVDRLEFRMPAGCRQGRGGCCWSVVSYIFISFRSRA